LADRASERAEYSASRGFQSVRTGERSRYIELNDRERLRAGPDTCKQLQAIRSRISKKLVAELGRKLGSFREDSPSARAERKKNRNERTSLLPSPLLSLCYHSRISKRISVAAVTNGHYSERRDKSAAATALSPDLPALTPL
jgi:hypothetical protein